MINLGSEVNTMTLAYATKLGLKVYYIDVGAQKIDSSIFETFEIILASFKVEDKFEKIRFFQKTFLLTDISIEVDLSRSFLTFSDANI